jgi:hypothetical protein
VRREILRLWYDTALEEIASLFSPSIKTIQRARKTSPIIMPADKRSEAQSAAPAFIANAAARAIAALTSSTAFRPCP